jgi:hypothetical protein
MAITALYLLSSNEVYKISPQGQTFDDRDPTYWGVLTDPDFPDGSGPVREVLPDGSWGDLRQLGFAKIAEPGTGANGTVRLATQPEIDAWTGTYQAYENKQDETRVKDWVENHPQFRKFFAAFADILIDEINILRAEHSLGDRTLAQLKTAMLNRISEND